jgi:signal transduction histidine kinase/FixJ family two-component response regulator
VSEDLVKVLLVDDDEEDYIITRELLAEVDERSFEVQWASSFDCAVEAMEEGGFDVYLFDFRLGEMTGLDLLNDPAMKDSDVPVIMMTGQGTREIDHDAMRAGASDYLVKGHYNSLMLERSIRYAIERKATELMLKEKQKALAEQHEEISNIRSMLERALEQISRLISKVIAQKDFSVRFNYPKLIICNEVMGCTREDCPCYNDENNRCWQVVGSFSNASPDSECTRYYSHCTRCPVYTDTMSDPIYMIGEQFNNMMHILEAKNRELEDSNTELKGAQAIILQQEKMASIGQLAAGVAHEINNPMGYISSNLAMLDKYVQKFMDFIEFQTGLIRDTGLARKAEAKRKEMRLDYMAGDVKCLMEDTLEGASRIKRIVQDLEGFGMVDEAECTVADINSCLESAIKILRSELEFKADLRKEYGDIPDIKCFPLELNQAFMNLLLNAAHSIDERGEIGVRTWKEGGNLNISISDTGCGIPEENMGRIFDPFFTTKEVNEGTGLGLSIAYGIVKKHNGDITVASQPGKGSTFTISIPAKGARD